MTIIEDSVRVALKNCLDFEQGTHYSKMKWTQIAEGDTDKYRRGDWCGLCFVATNFSRIPELRAAARTNDLSHCGIGTYCPYATMNMCSNVAFIDPKNMLRSFQHINFIAERSKFQKLVWDYEKPKEKERVIKLAVYGEEEIEADPTVYLRLHARTDGSVMLSACNRVGINKPLGALVKVNRNGTVHIMKGISRHLGFQLDEEGRIVII